jgi:hypothetical protein
MTVKTAPPDEEPVPHRLTAPKKTEWMSSGLVILSPLHEFRTPEMQRVHTTVAGWSLHWRKYRDEAGEVQLDTPKFSTKLVVGGKTLNLALGGLHSIDESLVLDAHPDWITYDIDAGSYYPAIALALGLAPEHMDRECYLDLYRALRQRRMVAKAAGDTVRANGLKIAINAIFGKFSDRYSKLLDPVKGSTITLNGEFMLLCLIERLLALDGLELHSVNTDGIMVRLPRARDAELKAIIAEVAAIYTLEFEIVEVSALRRINISEFAMRYHDRGVVKVKTRGARFNEATKKAEGRIIKRAAMSYLLDRVPVEKTITECRDLNLFIFSEATDKTSHVETETGDVLPQHINRHRLRVLHHGGASCRRGGT